MKRHFHAIFPAIGWREDFQIPQLIQVMENKVMENKVRKQFLQKTGKESRENYYRSKTSHGKGHNKKLRKNYFFGKKLHCTLKALSIPMVA